MHTATASSHRITQYVGDVATMRGSTNAQVSGPRASGGMGDTPGLGPGALTGVQVRVLSRAPYLTCDDAFMCGGLSTRGTERANGFANQGRRDRCRRFRCGWPWCGTRYTDVGVIDRRYNPDEHVAAGCVTPALATLGDAAECSAPLLRDDQPMSRSRGSSISWCSRLDWHRVTAWDLRMRSFGPWTVWRSCEAATI